jgi:hypothetical protein
VHVQEIRSWRSQPGFVARKTVNVSRRFFGDFFGDFVCGVANNLRGNPVRPDQGHPRRELDLGGLDALSSV